MTQKPRPDGRAPNQLRPVNVQLDIAPSALSSVLLSMGNTQVICAVSIEESVPPWMVRSNAAGGWLTAEYSLLPYSTKRRARREGPMKTGGRTMEIQRLIGRSLRAAIDLKKIGPRTLMLDCDVLQADGGTRTASITGGFLALRLAIERLRARGDLKGNPIRHEIAAVSVGIVDGQPLLDLPYVEDAAADTDMNVVMTADRRFIEVQGTAEGAPYDRDELNALLNYAEEGILELIGIQRSFEDTGLNG